MGHDDQAARNARAKSIRAEIDRVIDANTPESDDEESAASNEARPKSARELTDEAAAKAKKEE
ncbi:MAG: hypothetical protein ACM3SX_23745 [Deltaproteobacteria bacterium]